jgi:tetratricopeptide (TPR) repeat protein
LLLVASTFAVYAPVRHHEFLRYDDDRTVTGNLELRSGLSRESVVRAFSDVRYANWIPLTRISLQLDHALFGLDPAGFHLTNVALHAAAALLLFLALLRMTGGLYESAFVGAVFALHPLHVESVAWVSSRKDVLSGVFFMAALLAWARHAERPGLRRYAATGAWVVLGLLSKPTLVTLPLVLLLLDYWPLDRLRSDRTGRRIDGRRLSRALLEKLPLLLLAAVAGLVTLHAQRAAGTIAADELIPVSARWSNALQSSVVYAWKSLWPSGLAVFYPHPLEPSAWRSGLCAALLAAFTSAALAGARRRPYALVGWLWYLVTLAPVIGIVQVGAQARADRYTYLPLCGLAIAVAWGAPDLLARLRRRRVALAAAGLLCVAAMALSTRLSLRHWSDTLALFDRALQVTDANALAHHNRGSELQRLGRLDEALADFGEASRLRPDWAAPRLGIAAVHLAQGRTDVALAALRREVERDPTDLHAARMYGLALYREGRPLEALPHLERAATDELASPELHFALAVVYAEQGRAAESVRESRRALALDPGSRAAANNLAWILATCADSSVRDPEEALRIARALQRDDVPADAGALDTLAAALAATGRFDEAAAAAQRARHRAEAEGDAELSRAIDARIDLYRARRVYVEPPASAR